MITKWLQEVEGSTGHQRNLRIICLHIIAGLEDTGGTHGSSSSLLATAGMCPKTLLCMCGFVGFLANAVTLQDRGNTDKVDPVL